MSSLWGWPGGPQTMVHLSEGSASSPVPQREGAATGRGNLILYSPWEGSEASTNTRFVLLSRSALHRLKEQQPLS